MLKKRSWKNVYRIFKDNLYLLYLVLRHPDTPLPAKILTGLIAVYILSPIDIIPDFYPLLGYLDEIVLIPIFVDYVLKLVPPSILTACQAQAAKSPFCRISGWWLLGGLASLLLSFYLIYNLSR